MRKIITAFIFYFLIGECFSQAGEWVWIKGDSIPNQPGNYGVQGVPSPTNNPPSLYEPCEWTDLNGNFWMFGGTDTSDNLFGDLWKYEPATNLWTWMRGTGIPNSPGNYGTIGVADPANLPPCRALGISSWVDLSGDLWMYGGRATSNFDYGDLWKYNIASNIWTWMNGTPPVNSYPVYGTKGVPSVLNTPGSRSETSANWVDASGNLWLFGGFRILNLARYNDLWKYNITTGEWTWMKGSNMSSSVGYTAGLGIADSANTPGARISYCSWKDSNGAFWLFGGARDPFGVHFYNDVWTYDPVSNNWIWMDGPWGFDDTGVYGQLCDSSVNYIPRSRYEDRARWTDGCGRLIFYGGTTDSMRVLTERYNDLWYYNPQTLQWSMIDGTAPFNPFPFYGIINIAGVNNTPGGRRGAVSWKSNSGELFMFGGYMVDSLGFNVIGNDLWKFTLDPTCIPFCPTAIRENNLPKADELLVFPNPTNSSLTILFSSSEKQTIELRIYNTLGKQIYFSKEEITKGKFEKEINVKDFSAGIYFIQLLTQSGMVVKKFLKE